MNQENYRKIISGQGKGFAAGLLRLLLYIASFFYAAVIRLRNFFYDTGVFKTHKVNAVVISVGNITAGGTGKTPLVIWLCNYLHQQNISCAIITRGYKSATKSPQLHVGGQQPQATSDEPAVIAKSSPDAAVIINPDRIAGAKEAIEKFNAKVLILDDGFQHRRLSRNLDIVTIDAVEPFGFERLIPAGLLREQVRSLKRADAIVITHSDLISNSALEVIEQRMLNVNPQLVIAKAIHQPTKIVFSDGKSAEPENLKGKKVFAFCGIGSPDSFLRTLKACGAAITGSEIYDDHYHYAEDDVASLREKAKQLKADVIITTGKDWTKIKDFQAVSGDKNDMPFAYLEIAIKITGGEDELRRLITEATAGKIFKQ